MFLLYAAELDEVGHGIFDLRAANFDVYNVVFYIWRAFFFSEESSKYKQSIKNVNTEDNAILLQSILSIL